MDLATHQAVTRLGLSRAAKRLGQNLDDKFHPIWLGNWLTDMNQVTAFFDALHPEIDQHRRWDNGPCKLPPEIGADKETRKKWVKLFQLLWQAEWKKISKEPQYRNLPISELEPVSAEDIGAYCPCDHFDVVDWKDPKNPKITLPETFEFETDQTSYSPQIIHTVHESIHNYAAKRWLFRAFTMREAEDLNSLRVLGQGIHILQDFFAHTNFFEILLMLAVLKGDIRGDLAYVLKTDREGTFSSYLEATDPDQTFLMSGRFDRLDTVASILGIYRRGLIPRWEDLKAGGYAGSPGKARDLMFEVMFGTFSNNPVATKTIKAIKTVSELSDFFSRIGDKLKDGVIRLSTEIAKLFTDDEYDGTVQEIGDLLRVLESKEARDFGRVGRILYLEHVIEQKLRNELKERTRRLPHHTLLAKDRDVGQPEIRLVYKLACCLATDITTKILSLYFGGRPYSEVTPLLKRYFRHPKDFINDKTFVASLKKQIDDLYGSRWYLYADEDADRLLIP